MSGSCYSGNGIATAAAAKVAMPTANTSPTAAAASPRLPDELVLHILEMAGCSAPTVMRVSRALWALVLGGRRRLTWIVRSADDLPAMSRILKRTMTNPVLQDSQPHHTAPLQLEVLPSRRRRPPLFVKAPYYDDGLSKFVHELRLKHPYHPPSPALTSLIVSKTSNVSLCDLQYLDPFPNLTRIQLSRIGYGDLHLPPLPSLRELVVRCCCTDAISLDNPAAVSQLQHLTLHGNDGLKSLDLSACTQLRSLQCIVHRGLESLDVSMCAQLTRLDCGDNNLTSLVLPQPAALPTVREAVGRTVETVGSSRDQMKAAAEAMEVAMAAAKAAGRAATAAGVAALTAELASAMDTAKLAAQAALAAVMSASEVVVGVAADSAAAAAVAATAVAPLCELLCSSNCLTSLNINVETHRNLRSIECYLNNFRELPEGLAELTSLTSLDCSSNPLTSLSIPSSLISLECQGCCLTSLIGLQHATGLQVLSMQENCFGDNAYEIVEEAVRTGPPVPQPLFLPSRYVNLRSLDCDYLSLPKLDVSHLRHLTSLYCCECEMEELLFGSHHRALVEVVCCGNLLVNLDLSSLPALRVLDCSDNDLASLDISTNWWLRSVVVCCNHLTRLEGVSGAFMLHELQVYNNKLRSLTLGEHPELKILGCDNNPLVYPLDLTHCPLLDPDDYTYTIRRDQ